MLPLLEIVCKSACFEDGLVARRVAERQSKEDIVADSRIH